MYNNPAQQNLYNNPSQSEANDQIQRLSNNFNLDSSNSRNFPNIQIQRHCSQFSLVNMRSNQHQVTSNNQVARWIQNQQQNNQMIQQTPNTKKPLKNILRTLSSYVHKYILFNEKAKIVIREYFFNHFKQQEAQQKIKQFNLWVKNLSTKKSQNNQKKKYQSMESFQQYRFIWHSQNNELFGCLYRQLSYTYYQRQAYCDIWLNSHSNQHSNQIKKAMFAHIHFFLTGIQDPLNFWFQR